MYRVQPRRRGFLLFPLIFLVLWVGSGAGAATFYVARDGDDAWSGTSADPNDRRTDGPFATLQRARDVIRALKRQDPPPRGGLTVEIRGGTYVLEEPFELSDEDSGTELAPIVYHTRDGEKVRLTGGKLVAGFKPVTDPAILERLDESARGKVFQADLKALGIKDFGPAGGGGLELFFDDEPMTPARWPNEGFTHVVELAAELDVDVRGTKGSTVGKFIFEGDRPKRWADEKDVWVHGYWFWDWSDQRHKVRSIDTETRVITIEPPYHGYGYRKGQWYYAFNILSEIDSPGEWYLDRESGVLYFWPPKPIESGRAVVSMLDSLVVVRDTAHVTLQGMTLEVVRGNAVTVHGGSNVRLDRCVVRNVGSNAVVVHGGKDIGVVNCHIHHAGRGGVRVSGGDRKTLTPAGHYVDNNHIHHYGRWDRVNHPAISLVGVGSRAAHNLIHDAPHMAIFFAGNDHLIELNEIHHVCLESNDAGAIYAGRDWTTRGTVIRHNFLHHITGFRGRGCMGVYLDDMFCGTRIAGNVFYQVTRAVFIGGGRDNVVENNLFVECAPALHLDARAMGWAGYIVGTIMTERLEAIPYKKPPWSKRYPKLVNILDQAPAEPRGNRIARNVFWKGRWDEFRKGAERFATFQDNLHDTDPGFVAPRRMNFQLRDDSPVYRKIPGFEKIPFEQIGPVKRER